MTGYRPAPRRRWGGSADGTEACDGTSLLPGRAGQIGGPVGRSPSGDGIGSGQA